MDLYKTGLSALDGIGQKREQLFKKLGVDSVGALLEFYPRLYEDWSVCFNVSEAPLDTKCCVKATVCTNVRENRIRKGLTIYSFSITDGRTKIRVSIFNNKYLASKAKLDEEILLFGKVTIDKLGYRVMNTPQIELVISAKIRPIYRQTEGLNSTIIEKTVMSAFKLTNDCLFDNLSESIRDEFGLCHKRFAIEKIHFPDSQNDINVARNRLIFEELLVFSIAMMKLKTQSKNVLSNQISNDYTAELLKNLPEHLKQIVLP